MPRTVLFLALMLSAAPLFANDAESDAAKDPLTQLIATSHHTMSRSEEEFAGPGAALLLGEAEQSTFLLIGESHGNVETPALTSWLLQAIRPFGYTTLAVAPEFHATTPMLDMPF